MIAGYALLLGTVFRVGSSLCRRWSASTADRLLTALVVAAGAAPLLARRISGRLSATVIIEARIGVTRRRPWRGFLTWTAELIAWRRGRHSPLPCSDSGFRLPAGAQRLPIRVLSPSATSTYRVSESSAPRHGGVGAEAGAAPRRCSPLGHGGGRATAGTIAAAFALTPPSLTTRRALAHWFAPGLWCTPALALDYASHESRPAAFAGILAYSTSRRDRASTALSVGGPLLDSAVARGRRTLA